MTAVTASSAPETRAIVVDETFPHAPEVVWRAITDSALMSRWMMPPTGFVAEVGTRFTFTTKPAGKWDGTISCQVLEVVEQERLAFSWSGGDAGNAGYGSRLETIVTIMLSPADGGTRVRLIHAGFLLPRNEVAYRNMSEGWTVVLKRLEAVVADPATSH